MPERTSVKGKLFRRISKSLSDYCIFICSTSDTLALPSALKRTGGKAYFTVVGNNLPAIDSVEVEYFGEWVSNKKYGMQFKADSYNFVSPRTEKGISAFLKSKAFPGIGAKTADAIVAQFGKNTFEVIKNEPNKLLTIPGITPTKMGLIVSSYKRNEAYSSISVFLSQFGISSDAIIKINELYGADAVEIIKANPYAIQTVRGIGFKTCDRIVRALKVSLDSFERVRGAVLEIMKARSMQTGDTIISTEDLINDTLILLNEGLNPPPVSEDILKSVAKQMGKNGEIVFRKKSYVLLKEYNEAEELTVKKLLSMVSKDTPVPGLTVISEVESYRKESKVKLSDGQADAVKLALQSRVSVITGGPGTGKTTILSAVIACYNKLYKLPVTLLAPTGKAARRMSEATGEHASTIHRKLGIYYSSSFTEPISIPTGLIVVDESSMVDTLLMGKLMSSVHPDSHIVFIGDADQLPSISAGSVLSDMIDSGMIPVARLTEIFRQSSGGLIVSNARKINSGETDLSVDNDFKLINISSEDEALSIIKKTYAEQVKIYGIENVALLSPLRKTQNGRFSVVSDRLNPLLQDVVNPRVEGAYCILNGIEYRLKDRVLQWKNTEKSSNGDTGEIISIGELNEDTAVKIRWDNGNETIETRQSMADISLAYSVSIHKSQGGEYKSVIIPLIPQQKCQLFRRNLLYTAVTRSKQSCIILSDKSTIDYCIRTCDANKRRTLMKKRFSAYAVSS